MKYENDGSHTKYTYIFIRVKSLMQAWLGLSYMKGFRCKLWRNLLYCWDINGGNIFEKYILFVKENRKGICKIKCMQVWTCCFLS